MLADGSTDYRVERLPRLKVRQQKRKHRVGTSGTRHRKMERKLTIVHKVSSCCSLEVVAQFNWFRSARCTLVWNLVFCKDRLCNVAVGYEAPSPIYSPSTATILVSGLSIFHCAEISGTGTARYNFFWTDERRKTLGVQRSDSWDGRGWYWPARVPPVNKERNQRSSNDMLLDKKW